MSDGSVQARVYGMADGAKRSPPPPAGFRGEGAAAPADDAFRHHVPLEDGGTVVVVEASGVAFAEATGRISQPADSSAAIAALKERLLPAPPEATPRPLLPWLLLGLVTGFMLGRRRSPPPRMAVLPVVIVDGSAKDVDVVAFS